MSRDGLHEMLAADWPATGKEIAIHDGRTGKSKPDPSRLKTGKLNPFHPALPFLERSLFRSGDHGMDPLFGAFLGSTASKNVSIVFLTDEDMLTKMMY